MLHKASKEYAMCKNLHPRIFLRTTTVLIWVVKHPRVVEMCIGTEKFRKSLIAKCFKTTLVLQGKSKQVDELVTRFRQEPDKSTDWDL